MKTIFLSILFIFAINLCNAQEIKSDIWSGSYGIYALNGKELPIIDTIKMLKTKDAKIEDVAANLESDLKRWTISTKHEDRSDQKDVRRFLFDLEDDQNEYKEFGWTNLHKEGKMNCIDGGSFFICQTTPGTTVKFGKADTFETKTGIFGIWLHVGIAELKKLE